MSRRSMRLRGATPDPTMGSGAPSGPTPRRTYRTPNQDIQQVMSPNPRSGRLAAQASDTSTVDDQVEELQRSLVEEFSASSTTRDHPQPSEEEEETEDSEEDPEDKPSHEDQMGPLSATFSIPEWKHVKLESSENFQLWRNRLFTVMRALGLEQIMLGSERFDDRWSAKVKRCWKTRHDKALTLLNLSLHEDLVMRFDRFFADGDVVHMWRALVDEFGGKIARNAVLIRTDIYSRRMTRDEGVKKYVDDLLSLHAELSKTGEEMSLDELARVMLTNVMEVYEDISREYALMAAKGRFPTFGEAKNTLIAREDSARHHRQRNQAPRDNGRQVNLVQRGRDDGARGPDRDQREPSYANQGRSSSATRAFVTTATVLGTTRETVVTVVDRGQINDGARVVIAHPRIDHTVNNNNGPRLRLKNQTSRETRETYRVPW